MIGPQIPSLYSLFIIVSWSLFMSLNTLKFMWKVQSLRPNLFDVCYAHYRKIIVIVTIWKFCTLIDVGLNDESFVYISLIFWNKHMIIGKQNFGKWKNIHVLRSIKWIKRKSGCHLWTHIIVDRINELS